MNFLSASTIILINSAAWVVAIVMSDLKVFVGVDVFNPHAPSN
jgi:hypothetical protein